MIDPRKIELTRYATLHLQLRPGTNVPLLNAMACTIVEEGLYDEGFLKERVAGFEEFRHFVQSWSPERAAPVCGVEAREIREAARIYAKEGPAMCIHGLGVTEHTQGTEGVMCLVNLASADRKHRQAGCRHQPLARTKQRPGRRSYGM